VDEHEEVELMLESYLKTAEELASRTQVLASNMSSTEDIVNISLMGQRNEMLLLELRLGIGTFAVEGESLSVDTAEQLEQARAIAAEQPD
jgi:magnesium transporter